MALLWSEEGGGLTNMTPTSRLRRLTPPDKRFLQPAPGPVRTIIQHLLISYSYGGQLTVRPSLSCTLARNLRSHEIEKPLKTNSRQ